MAAPKIAPTRAAVFNFQPTKSHLPLTPGDLP